MSLSAEPLLALARELDLTADVLAREEHLERLAGTFTVTAASVAALTRASLEAFVAGYGDSARLVVATGALPELTVEGGGYDPEELEALVARAARTRGEYEVVVEIDKAGLAEALAPGAPATVRLFLFTSVLVRYLAAGPVAVERELWTDPSARLVAVVLDSGELVEGPCLSVVGYARPDAEECLRAAAGRAAPGDLARLADRRLDYVGWDSSVTTRLTPLHFRRAPVRRRTNLTDRLDLLAIGLGAMYLCDRARLVAAPGRRPYVQAEFRGREHVAFVPVDWSRLPGSVTDPQLEAFADLVDWCYESVPEHRSSDMVADRLPFVQTRVAQLLEGLPEQDRLLALAASMPAVDEGIRGLWRSFIEGRVTEYLQQVRELEGAVDQAVQRFADHTAAVVKRLTDTSLAAVAALIASFIAAAFRDPFQADLFRIGMLAYAGYVVVFPCLVGLTSAWGDGRLADRSFAVQREHLEAALGAERVQAVVANRTTKAKRRFYRWLVAVGFLYLAAAGAAAAAAFLVPRLLVAGAP